MSDPSMSRAEPSSSSYESAVETSGNANIMDTLTTSINAGITALSSLVDGFSAQINEIKETQRDIVNDIGSIKEEIDSVKEAQPQSSTIIDGLDDLHAQTDKLQGAVDEVLKQHNVLTARVQTLSQGHATTTAVNTTQAPARPDAPLTRSQHHRAENTLSDVTRADVARTDIQDDQAILCDCRNKGHHTLEAHTLALSAKKSMGPPPARAPAPETSPASSVTLRGDTYADEYVANVRAPQVVRFELPNASDRRKRKRGTTDQAIDPTEGGGEEVRLDHAAKQHSIDEEQDAATKMVPQGEANQPVGFSFDSDTIQVAIRVPQRAKTKAVKVAGPQATAAARSEIPRPRLVVLPTPAAALKKLESLSSAPSSPTGTGNALGNLHQQFGIRKGDSQGKTTSVETTAENPVAAEPTPEEEPDSKRRRSERKTKPSDKKQRAW